MELTENNVKYPNLRAEMAKRGENQSSIGELLGLPPASIHRRFSGEIEWTITEINTLCKHFKKSYEELFS